MLDKKKTAFTVITILLVLVFLEGTLSLLALVSPRVHSLLESPTAPHTIPDERLGFRPNPDHPEHDRKGFRNRRIPARAHIVALGDSQTYGTGVSSEDAWPKQLAAMIGEPVYNMSFGGYGPAHSLILVKEAFEVDPKIIITTFYAGNDLFDSFDLVYNLGQLPELASPQAERQGEIQALEAADPLADRVGRMFNMGVAAEETRENGSDSRYAIVEWVSASRLFGLLRRAYHECVQAVSRARESQRDEWQAAKAFASSYPDYCQLFDNGRQKSVMTSAYRLAALELSDPRIAEGLSISLGAIQQMYLAAKERGVRFITVLIPTKETVFSVFPENPDPTYQRLVSNEKQLWEKSKGFLEENGIDYLDALPVLQQQLLRENQPYPVTQDGHPNAYGHQAIAGLIASYLEG